MINKKEFTINKQEFTTNKQETNKQAMILFNNILPGNIIPSHIIPSNIISDNIISDNILSKNNIKLEELDQLFKNYQLNISNNHIKIFFNFFTIIFNLRSIFLNLNTTINKTEDNKKETYLSRLSYLLRYLKYLLKYFIYLLINHLMKNIFLYFYSILGIVLLYLIFILIVLPWLIKKPVHLILHNLKQIKLLNVLKITNFIENHIFNYKKNVFLTKSPEDQASYIILLQDFFIKLNTAIIKYKRLLNFETVFELEIFRKFLEKEYEIILSTFQD